MPNGGTEGGVDYASQGLAVIAQSPLGSVSNPQQLGGSGLGTAHKRLADDHNPTPNTLLLHTHTHSSKQMHGYTPTAARAALEVSKRSMCVSFKARRSHQHWDILAIRKCGEVFVYVLSQ